MRIFSTHVELIALMNTWHYLWVLSCKIFFLRMTTFFQNYLLRLTMSWSLKDSFSHLLAGCIKSPSSYYNLVLLIPCFPLNKQTNKLNINSLGLVCFGIDPRLALLFQIICWKRIAMSVVQACFKDFSLRNLESQPRLRTAYGN